MLKYAGKILKTAPSTRFCTTAELGRVLSMTFPEADTAFAQSLIDSATAMLEAKTNHYFCPQTYDVFYTGRGYTARIPLFPVASVTSVTVDDVVLTSEDYTLDMVSGAYEVRLVNAASERVKITLIVGYQSPNLPPPCAKTAVLAIAADLHEHREAQSEVSLTENKSLKYAIEPLKFYNAW